MTPFRSMIAPNYPLKGLFSSNLTQPPLWAAWDPSRGWGSPADVLSATVNMSEATYLACYWLFGMTLAILHWYQRGQAPTQMPDPVAPLQPCCGMTRQSKKLSSIINISGNLLSSLFIWMSSIINWTQLVFGNIHLSLVFFSLWIHFFFEFIT